MGKIQNNNDSESDSDEEHNAKLRQFMEAADHTLFSNDMFQKQTTTQPALLRHVPPATGTENETNAVPTAAEQNKKLKSQRYLDEQSENAAFSSDLQIGDHVQAHLWRKLSIRINNQIEFYSPSVESIKEADETADMEFNHQVKLVADADCYICDDIETEMPPQKKPHIRRRQLENEPQAVTPAEAFASVVLSGEDIMKGKDVEVWAKRPARKHKYFEYKSCDKEGLKFLAVEPVNEFTALRRKNNWNESKICKTVNL